MHLYTSSIICLWVYECVCACECVSPRGVSLAYHGVVDKRNCLCDTTDYCRLVWGLKQTQWEDSGEIAAPLCCSNSGWQKRYRRNILHLLWWSVFIINDSFLQGKHTSVNKNTVRKLLVWKEEKDKFFLPFFWIKSCNASTDSYTFTAGTKPLSVSLWEDSITFTILKRADIMILLLDKDESLLVVAAGWFLLQRPCWKLWVIVYFFGNWDSWCWQHSSGKYPV